MKQPFLFVALDDLDKKEKETLEVAERLSSVEGPFGFKLNLDYLLNPMFGVKTLLFQVRQRFGRPIFADLKMWNGTRTMRSVIETLVNCEVDYLNVYALADGLLPEAIKATEGSKTKVFGLTVLTHFTEGYCRKWFKRSLKDTVKLAAEVALERGCHGIILPGTALDVVKDLDTDKCTPGIRLEWYPADSRHQQEVTPRIAVEQRATHLVCGGPIMKSVEKAGIDNVEALKRVLSEMMGQ